MARTAKQTAPQEFLTGDEDTPGLPAAVEALNTEIVAKKEQETHVRALAAHIGYQLPADCIDPDLIQRDIGANMRRSVEACLEVGRGLAVLKAACGHGNFIARLDVLGLEPRVAQKFMQSATKFANASSTAHLAKAIGNQTKLFEMLVLDDEQIEELELTGQTGELKLDEIATMSVKELRAKLREAQAGQNKEIAGLKADAEAKERLLEDKNAKLDAMDLEIHKLRNRSGEWHPRTFEIAMENTRVMGQCMEALDRLNNLREIILNEDFDGQDAEAAIESMAVVYYDSVAQIVNRLAEVSLACEQVFIGYKHKARPMLDVFGPQGQEG